MLQKTKIASIWRFKTNLTIFTDLYQSERTDDSDCGLCIPGVSGFHICGYVKGQSAWFRGFFPEASVLSLSQIMPQLTIRALEEASNIPPIKSNADEETVLFATPFQFHMAAGMNLADMLANHYSASEFQELATIMERNKDKYPVNNILCEGIDRILKMINAGDTSELNRIIGKYRSPGYQLHDGNWKESGKPNEDGIAQKGKIEIFINFRAENPFGVRLTTRTCKADSTAAPSYPYIGCQVSSIYLSMTAEDFLAQFLYPMRESSRGFREEALTRITHSKSTTRP